MSSLRILLVEDSDDDALLLQRVLRRQGMEFTVTHVPDRSGFEHAILTETWDAVVSDFHLQGVDAIQLLTWLRERDPDLPFLVVSGKVGEELAVAVMRSGANDFLVKGQLARLGPALEREARDASSRRHQREAERSRITLQQAVVNMADGLVVTDQDGVILYVNPAMVAISGYSESELIGRKPSVFRSGKQEDSFYLDLWRTLTEGRVWRGTFINMRKDGSLWHSEAVIAPVRGARGEVGHYVCTNRDVTAQRKLETRLQESQRMEALGVLTAGVAHDFNNLLMPILVHAEVGLRHAEPDSKEARQLQVIVGQCERAKGLIRQLVGYSREHQEPPERLELKGFLEESLDLLKAALPPDIRLTVEVSSERLHVMGVSTRIQQILLNLVNNAVHAMEGGGDLRVSLRRSSEQAQSCVMGETLPGGAYAVLEVQDTGHGIAPDRLESIFLPFFTTKHRHQGTGLGLSIVLGLVREMGGGMQVETAPGAGATFRVLLPVMSAAGAVTEPARIPTPSPSLSPRTLNFLMVDDDPLVLDAMARALMSMGHQVHALRNPAKAVLWFRDQSQGVDVAILDHAMPDCTGLDVLEALKAIRPDLPAYVFTGNVDQVDMNRAAALGCDGVLQKPMQIKELLELIEERLGIGERGHPAP